MRWKWLNRWELSLCIPFVIIIKGLLYLCISSSDFSISLFFYFVFRFYYYYYYCIFFIPFIFICLSAFLYNFQLMSALFGIIHLLLAIFRSTHTVIMKCTRAIVLIHSNCFLYNMHCVSMLCYFVCVKCARTMWIVRSL